MMRSHQSVARLALIVATAAVLPTGNWLAPSTANAQDAAAPAADVPADLAKAVENYWHYGKVARYDLQNAEGAKIVDSGADPSVILKAFENTASARNDQLDNWILRWQGVKDAADTANKIGLLIQKGRQSLRENQAYIESQIKRLGSGERAYILAVGQLRESGELAVPLMVSYLRNPEQASLAGPIRRALRDMGRTVINPLVAATEMRKNTDTLIAIIDVLADIGYDVPAPYLLKLNTASDVPASVKQAAAGALARMGGSQGASAADAFYELAERTYYGKTALTPDPQAAAAYVWYWDEEKGLNKKDVPPVIFGPVMTMRASEYAMKLGDSRADALSLWLAANYKREALLPDGTKDATRPDNFPTAHYFGVSAGAGSLYMALDRALKDGDAPVALRVIKSLGEIVGTANLPKDESQPLVAALRFPDRLVRYEAAFALAAAQPAEPYAGSERVIPLLAEAIAQTGTTSVAVYGPATAEGWDLNKFIGDLKGAGITAVGGSTPSEVANASASLPSVDAIIITEKLPRSEIDKLWAEIGGNPRLERAPKIVVVNSGASPYVVQAATDPLISTSGSGDANEIKTAIEVARKKAGSLPLDEKTATDYALKSAALLQGLAGRTHAYDLMSAETSLLAALNDTRPEIVKAAGNVLSTLDSRQAQSALLTTATGEKAADDVKISLYKSLAGSAKRFGDRLGGDQHATLEKVVADGTNLDVRAAAAEARGALNLPAEQAKTIIMGLSK